MRSQRTFGPETTVRIAVIRDYQVVFVSDYTANKDILIPADVAEKGLVSLVAQAFCRVIESSELISNLGEDDFFPANLD